MSIQKRTEDLANWFLAEYMRLGRLDTGPQMFREMDQVLSKAVAVVDRKIARVWLGDCDCGRSVRTHPDKSSVTCQCGVAWDVKKAREELKALGEDQLVSAADAESLGEIYGAKIKKSTIRVWHHRGKILCLSQSCSKGCSHVYRFGDLLELHKGLRTRT